MSDSELVSRAAAGDRDALDALWRGHRRWVAALLLGHLPAGAELEDLLQEVAVILLEHVRGLRDAASFRPWLAQVSRRVALGQARRQQVRRRHVQPLRPDEPGADPAAPRDQRAEAAAELERVLALARALPAEYREPLLLRAVDGLSQQEIADILSLPVTTVETRLARARGRLRAALAAQDGRPSSPRPATLFSRAPLP